MYRPYGVSLRLLERCLLLRSSENTDSRTSVNKGKRRTVVLATHTTLEKMILVGSFCPFFMGGRRRSAPASVLVRAAYPTGSSLFRRPDPSCRCRCRVHRRPGHCPQRRLWCLGGRRHFPQSARL